MLLMTPLQATLRSPAPRVLAAVALAAFVVAWPAPAWADAGIPMLALVWPLSWLAFLPVVLIEAYVAVRMFGLAFPDTFKLALKANAWSTLAGIPATWFLLLLIEIVIGDLFGHLLWESNPMIGWALTPLMLAWIGSSGPSWTLFATAAGLCVPFYFMSVWVEARSARKRLGIADAWRWARLANAVTYGLCILVLAVAAVDAAAMPARGEYAVPPSEYRRHRAIQDPKGAKLMPLTRGGLSPEAAGTGAHPR
jgi:hypothetical protein